MKRSILLIPVIFLMIVIAACMGNNSSTAALSEEDQIATVVASTLSAIPTSTPVPTVAITAQSSNLEDFTNKELLGEDDSYSVYLINSSDGDDPEKIGEIIIYDKSKEIVYEMIGTFILPGTTIVSDDGKGEYVLLSTGTYTSRTAIVLSLIDKKQAVNNFCTSSGEFGDHLFWNDFVITNNCDTFNNRPWGAGEAPSITAINLKTGAVTVIAKSDLTRHFQIKSIADNNLQYLEISVENEEGWQNPDRQSTTPNSYNLLSLENN
jgi:hypothetical protein